jgi:hypothetical protein
MGAPVSLGAPEWVTGDFIRMREPLALASLAALADTSAETAAMVDDAAGPLRGRLAALTATAPEPVAGETMAAQRAPRQPANLPPCAAANPSSSAWTERSGIQRPGVAAPTAAASSMNGRSANAAALARAFSIDINPGDVDLGDLKVGERRTARVRIVVADDGVLSISPPRHASLQIARLFARTGALSFSGQAGAPRHAQLGGTTVIIAPFKVPVVAGQEVDLDVRLTPSPADGYAGDPADFAESLQIAVNAPDGYRASLGGERGQLLAEGSVRLSARVAGVLYGIGVDPPPEVVGIEDAVFEVPVDSFNHGDAGQAVLAVDRASLPAGLTLVGAGERTLSLAAGESRTEEPFRLYVQPGTPLGGIVTLTLKLSQTSGQGTRTVAYPVPVLLRPAVTHWTISRFVRINGGSLISNGDFYLYANGAWLWTSDDDNLTGCDKVDFNETVLVGARAFARTQRLGNNNGKNGQSRQQYRNAGVAPGLATLYRSGAVGVSVQASTTCYTGDPTGAWSSLGLAP